jgi:thiol-disulfide isomerase/thioredoxin
MRAIHRMMFRAFVVALAVGAGVATCAPGASAGEDAGALLMSHTLRSLDGGEIQLSAFKGDVIVVNFWASWCAPCRKELPIMNQWNNEWAGRGARVIAISIDSDVAKAKRFAEQTKLSLPLFHDGPAGLAKMLDLPSLPCTYLVDRSGKVVTVIRSSSPKELAALEQQAESLMGSSRTAQRAGMDNGGGISNDRGGQ